MWGRWDVVKLALPGGGERPLSAQLGTLFIGLLSSGISEGWVTRTESTVSQIPWLEAVVSAELADQELCLSGCSLGPGLRSPKYPW